MNVILLAVRKEVDVPNSPWLRHVDERTVFSHVLSSLTSIGIHDITLVTRADIGLETNMKTINEIKRHVVNWEVADTNTLYDLALSAWGKEKEDFLVIENPYEFDISIIPETIDSVHSIMCVKPYADGGCLLSTTDKSGRMFLTSTECLPVESTGIYFIKNGDIGKLISSYCLYEHKKMTIEDFLKEIGNVRLFLKRDGAWIFN